MNTLFEIPNKEYILNNRHNICIYCKDNVQEVRDYLELVCRFNKAGWDTSRYTGLNWLFINRSNEVHGEYSDNGYGCGRTNVSITELLKSYNELSDYKPINLKK